MDIQYQRLDEFNAEQLIPILNHPKIRQHLIDHVQFDTGFVQQWINGKMLVDATPGCRVRAVVCDGRVVGWCGIQIESGRYEMALVIAPAVWGIGKRVFTEMMGWAKELGHDDIYIHFLHTRPAYKFLCSIAIEVFESEWQGNKFTTYRLPVQ